MMGKPITLWILLGLSLVLLALLPFVGMEMINPWTFLSNPNVEMQQLFWQLRLPRILAGMLAGAGLATAGVTYQAMFQNPLATPFTLGTASGASLGASIYIWSGLSFALLGIPGLMLFAFLGALLAMALVYLIARLKDGLTGMTMLLAGVALSITFSSFILLFQYLSDQAHSLRILRWLMGGLDVVGYQQLLQTVPFVMQGLVAMLMMTMPLNLLATGPTLAAARGLDVGRVKLIILLTTGVMVGAVVSVAGPVGFLGLMVPHIGRRLIGPDHRLLLPVSLIGGAVLLPVCDTIARVIIAPAELPVGIVTALIGGPFFIWVLIRR